MDDIGNQDALILRKASKHAQLRWLKINETLSRTNRYETYVPYSGSGPNFIFITVVYLGSGKTIAVIYGNKGPKDIGKVLRTGKYCPPEGSLGMAIIEAEKLFLD